MATYQFKKDFKPHVGEYNNPRKFGHYVETIGYVPVQKQVDSFFRAGQRIIDQFSDSDFDTSEDDPQDNPLLDARDWELEEVGAAIAKLGTLTDSAAQQSEALSKAEAAKNESVGTPESSGAENSGN